MTDRKWVILDDYESDRLSDGSRLVEINQLVHDKAITWGVTTIELDRPLAEICRGERNDRKQ